MSPSTQPEHPSTSTARAIPASYKGPVIIYSAAIAKASRFGASLADHFGKAGHASLENVRDAFNPALADKVLFTNRLIPGAIPFAAAMRAAGLTEAAPANKITFVTSSPTALGPDTGDRRFFPMNPAARRVVEMRPGTYELRNAQDELIGISQPNEPRQLLARNAAVRMAYSKELAMTCSLIDMEYGMTGAVSAATIEQMRNLLISMAAA